MTEPHRIWPRHFNRAMTGLTLIELMVGLVVLGALTAIGLPSFRGAINNSRLSSTSNELLGAVQLARAEAIRGNGRVVFCQSANGTACSNDPVWVGWMLFTDSNGDGAVSAGEPIIKSGLIDASLQVRASPAISGGSNLIRFGANGLALGATETALFNARIAVCVASTEPAINVRDITISSGGRTSILMRSSAGVCSTAPSDT
mgnify:CR=1 FL=1